MRTRGFDLRIVVALGILGALVAGGCGGSDTDPAYVEEIDTWHGEREDRLRSETGWLTLVGLHPLEEGEQTFGSDSSNVIVFPAGSPAHAGVIQVADSLVAVVVAPNVVITRDGERVNSAALIPDTREGTTVLELGSLQFYVIERAGKYYIRLKDRESELLKNFTGIERFPVAARWRLRAEWKPYASPKVVMVPNALGYESEDSCRGVVEFDLDGEIHRLEPSGDLKEGLFFVFGDGTNGQETYGGGRFLYLSEPDSTGTIWLDFNRAYNPPCVFTEYATCPLPRPENVLPFRVEAGEKMYGAGH
jgi:uncharacterized protein (DUF1684 family)